jgi:hypothetical protein
MVTFVGPSKFDPDRFMPSGIIENAVKECRRAPTGLSLVLDGPVQENLQLQYGLLEGYVGR